MSLLDWIIIVVILLAATLALIHIKKNGVPCCENCTGNCSNCKNNSCGEKK